MKAMFWLAALMQFVVLMNVTVFNGDWDGIMMWLTTGLFIGICAVYASERMKRNRVGGSD